MVTTHWNQRKHGSKPGLPGDPWNKNTELGKFPKIRIFWIASLGKSLGYFSIFKFSILCHRRTSTSKLKSTTASHIFLVTGFIHHKETANIKTSEALTSRYVFFLKFWDVSQQIPNCLAAFFWCFNDFPQRFAARLWAPTFRGIPCLGVKSTQRLDRGNADVFGRRGWKSTWVLFVWYVNNYYM